MYFVYISLLVQVFMSENWAIYKFLRWWEGLDSGSREDLDSWVYPVPAHVPFQIVQKANTWKSNQIKGPQNDKWNINQCFELLFHMFNKPHKKKKRETWGKADPHVIIQSWANQEKWKWLEMIRLWSMSWLNQIWAKMDGNGLQKKMLLHIHDNVKKNVNNTFISLNQWGNVKMNHKMQTKAWGQKIFKNS